MLAPAMTTRRPKLYALPASAPCAAVEAALELKSIEYDRVEAIELRQRERNNLRRFE